MANERELAESGVRGDEMGKVSEKEKKSWDRTDKIRQGCDYQIIYENMWDTHQK